MKHNALLCSSKFRWFGTKAANKVGFIGLGQMGAPMAKNLAAEFDVIVFDTNKDACRTFPHVASSIEELSSQVTVAFTMLPNSQIVSEVYLGSGGLLKYAQKNSLFIDCSTIDPQMTKTIHQHARKASCITLDAPVSGGVKGARDSTLTFMVGGPKENIAMAEPFLQAMGKRIFHCGPSGTGQVAKICNNLILAISMVGLSEALSLGENLGMDVRQLSEIINTSSGKSWASETYNPVPGVISTSPASMGYVGGFSSSLMLKDIKLAVNEANAIQMSLPLANLVMSQYQSLPEGYKDKDFSIIYKTCQKNSRDSTN